MRTLYTTCVLLLAGVSLGGCASFFAEKAAYDPAIHNAPGTISLSDPKLYTREALINERARDIGWIDELIEESKDRGKIAFKPDLVRDVEQVSALAAAIGLKTDPAAALSYRRSVETGDLHQEIDVLKLQLQLDQLRRDAELVRAQFPTQGVPVNADLGKLSDGSGTTPAGGTASAADQLKAAIDKLMLELPKRFDGEVKAIPTTGLTISPFDDFRDRSAYRDMLKSARNAAALDQLHDSGNARLIRLNFQASVIPDDNYRRSLGAVQLTVQPPVKGGPSADFLNQWVEYVNTDEAYRRNGALTDSPLIQSLVDNGTLEKVRIGTVDLLLPVLIDDAGRAQSPANIFHRSRWSRLVLDDTNFTAGALNVAASSDLNRNAELRRAVCEGVTPSQVSGLTSNDVDLVDRVLGLAYDREISYRYLVLATKVSKANAPLLDAAQERLDRARETGAALVDFLAADPNCSRHVAWYGSVPAWKALKDPATVGDNSIRIYEVGPREQVQQISTVARSASSLALAASLAASTPARGTAAEATGGYSRQATGRAAMLERAPSVVGYSVAGQSTFGWVVGPRVALDPKGEVLMEQALKPYDLSADLSIPGWWDSLELEVRTVWAPAPDMIAGGRLEDAKTGSRIIRIPLVRNTSDYRSLTEYLAGSLQRNVHVDKIHGGPVNACAKTSLFITGDNIWRAESVFVLGQVLKGSAISIAPDMRGIFVEVPATAPPAAGNLNTTLFVITPLGTSSGTDITYIPQPSGDSCKAKPAAAAAAPAADAVSIGDIAPKLTFHLPGKITLKVSGANLKKVAKVELDSHAGTLALDADAKLLTVEFAADETATIPRSDNVPLVFFEKEKAGFSTITTKYVRIER